MEYLEFDKNIRDSFDNVYAIHMKLKANEIIPNLLLFFESMGFSISASGDEPIDINDIDKAYLEKYYINRNDSFITIELVGKEFKFQLFLEHENSISLWFNDSGNQAITSQSFDYIKGIMRALSLKYKTTVYFVNEGEATFRYKIYGCNENGQYSSFDINNLAVCAKKVQ